ncbi:MAG: leucine-rich repeat domain-containing protein [Lachnospiraceae bacterium]|nr:leucine-rich repeat domain-containing protein [Lachnospiraceae bacterium]
MKRGTKVGWLLVAVSIIMCVWVIASQSVDADPAEDGFVMNGTELTGYTGVGGDVVIPGEVTSIASGAFANATGIRSITMPNSVTAMGTGVFSGCENLQAITLSTGLSAIPADTFYGCGALAAINIPEGVASIGNRAFYGCDGLASVTIPASVTSLPADALMDCNSLSNITVAAGNPSYKSADGCLYNGSGSKLLLVPAQKTSISLAAGTTTIGTGAFRNSCVESLSLSEGVTTIEVDAFTGSAISRITVPASVTTFGSQSGWTPDAITGYADTAAETYAKNNNIPFYVIGNNGTTDDPVDPGDDPVDPGDDPVDPGQPGDSPSGDNTTEGGSSGGTGNNTATGGAHVKDVTPTTADGIDPRFFLCFAVFAGGVGVILVSRFNKIKYVSDSRRR